VFRETSLLNPLSLSGERNKIEPLSPEGGKNSR